jgi:eukaryotic-like serine/threonine-protein kinase
MILSPGITMPDLLHSVRDVLAPRYRVERPLGRGGMATVFLAERVSGGGPIAIKVLHRELATALGPERFHREIEILSRLRHPHIVPVLDSDVAGTYLFLVMPYVNGENLRARIERDGQLPVCSALSIARDVAEAIDYAHRHNVLHRDVKPENILLEGDRALVCDFGLARAIDQSTTDSSSSGLVVGTPSYMSPEQAMARKDIGPASDVYALGCVVYEMLAGDPPFTGPSAQAIFARHVVDAPRPMRSVRPDLTAGLERAVLSALAKDTWARPRSAAAFVDSLETAAKLA